MIVISSTNINKTNNHLPSYLTEQKKESLNSNGHQLQQYQQNKPSPLIVTHWTQKKFKQTITV
jgi:hypothetical protein